MAGGVGRVGSAVGVVAKWVVVLSSRVKLGGLGRVQALHAAPRTVLVRTLPQVAAARVKATGQVSGRGTEGQTQKEIFSFIKETHINLEWPPVECIPLPRIMSNNIHQASDKKNSNS